MSCHKHRRRPWYPEPIQKTPGTFHPLRSCSKSSELQTVLNRTSPTCGRAPPWRTADWRLIIRTSLRRKWCATEPFWQHDLDSFAGWFSAGWSRIRFCLVQYSRFVSTLRNQSYKTFSAVATNGAVDWGYILRRIMNLENWALKICLSQILQIWICSWKPINCLRLHLQIQP